MVLLEKRLKRELEICKAAINNDFPPECERGMRGTACRNKPLSVKCGSSRVAGTNIRIMQCPTIALGLNEVRKP